MQEDISRSWSIWWVSSLNFSRLMACIFGENGMAYLSVAIMYQNGTVGKGGQILEGFISLFC
jgi:hypothetical protein